MEFVHRTANAMDDAARWNRVFPYISGVLALGGPAQRRPITVIELGTGPSAHTPSVAESVHTVREARMFQKIVGRDSQLATMDTLLADAPNRPAAVLIEGEAVAALGGACPCGA